MQMPIYNAFNMFINVFVLWVSLDTATVYPQQQHITSISMQSFSALSDVIYTYTAYR